ncbi:MAG: nicotinamide riboside transporter PnuC [Streptococcus sp.]
MGYAYKSIHSARPFRDSITDATNGVGQLLMTGLYREQWIFLVWRPTSSVSISGGEKSIHIQGMYWVYTLNSLARLVSVE